MSQQHEFLKKLKAAYVSNLLIPIPPKYVTYASIGVGILCLVVAIVFFYLTKLKNKKVCQVATPDSLKKLEQIKGLKTIKHIVSENDHIAKEQQS